MVRTLRAASSGCALLSVARHRLQKRISCFFVTLFRPVVRSVLPKIVNILKLLNILMINTEGILSLTYKIIFPILPGGKEDPYRIVVQIRQMHIEIIKELLEGY